MFRDNTQGGMILFWVVVGGGGGGARSLPAVCLSPKKTQITNFVLVMLSEEVLESAVPPDRMNTMSVGVTRNKNILNWLPFRRKKEFIKKVVMLGIDDSGKTTIMRRLDEDGITQLLPTNGFQIKTLSGPGGLRLALWDIAGKKERRSVWPQYLNNVDALIYVIDAHDKNRIKESILALHKITLDPQLEGIPVLVFANKMDLFNTINLQFIQKMCATPLRPFTSKVFEISALSGIGIQEGLEWLSSQLIYRASCEGYNESNFFW